MMENGLYYQNRTADRPCQNVLFYQSQSHLHVCGIAEYDDDPGTWLDGVQVVDSHVLDLRCVVIIMKPYGRRTGFSCRQEEGKYGIMTMMPLLLVCEV